MKWAPKSTFSATCPKSHFLDSTSGITTFPPSWVDPFSPFFRLFSCRKGGCELVPQQIAQNSAFSDQGAKLYKMWPKPLPKWWAHYLHFLAFSPKCTLGGPRVSPGSPRAAFSLILSWIFTHFVGTLSKTIHTTELLGRVPPEEKTKVVTLGSG